mgnify:CR=1 FL=1
MRKGKIMLFEMLPQVGKEWSEFCKKNSYISVRKLSAIVKEYLEQQKGEDLI